MKFVQLILAMVLALFAPVVAFGRSVADAAFVRFERFMIKNGLILCMANTYSQRTFDAALLLKAAGLVAATGDGSLILDVGTGLLDADLIIDVTALEIDSNNESYEIILTGSPDATFGTAANIVPLASITIGDHASTRLAVMELGADDTVGRYCVPIRNERNGTTYRYLRLTYVVVGTVVTGINFSAWLAKDGD